MLGVTAETAALSSGVLLCLQTIQHTNIRTPELLGYFIVRPENHMLHHARNEHRSNYADLPLIDLIFGSLRCKKGEPPEVGFWDGASRDYELFAVQGCGKYRNFATESLSSDTVLV